MTMYMTMYFYQAKDVKLVLNKWDIMGNGYAYSAALLTCFIIGFLIEAISVFVNGMEAKNKLVLTHTGELSIATRVSIALATTIRLFFAYMLMLAAMTFNAGILVAIVLGVTTGYLVLGFSDIKFDLVSDGRMFVSEYKATTVY